MVTNREDEKKKGKKKKKKRNCGSLSGEERMFKVGIYLSIA